MNKHRIRARRRGAAAVEGAIVLSLTLFLIFSLIIGGLGVSRYQLVASLARESARWASTRGRDYRLEHDAPLTTPQDVYTNVIQPNAVLLNPAKLTYTVTWDHSGQQPTYLNASNQPRKNNVRVTVTYQWIPEGYLGGLTLRSTSVMPISY